MEDNTIPAEARAIVNFRLLPGDTIADVLWHAKKVMKDRRVHINPVEGKFNEALPISSTKGPAYEGLSRVIQQVFGNYPVAPFVMLGGTDFQHFVPVCDNIYRFTSLVMDESFRGLEHGIDERIPIAGIAGDQQAALFGQACFQPGDAKCTYGTGAFILMNTGPTPVESRSGLLTTVGWKLGAGAEKGEICYALEGSAFIAGAVVQWLRDGLEMFATAAEIEPLARSVPDSGGEWSYNSRNT